VEWFSARFAEPSALARPRPELGSAASVAAARRALRCGALRELLDAVGEPVTTGRFADNVAFALRERALRVPEDPVAAERELCGDA
jgi:arabinofuranosyltransferase